MCVRREMQPERELALDHARAASADELNALLYECDEKLLLALLQNPNIQEKHIELLLGRSDVSSAVVCAVAEGGNWTSREVRLRLTQHPHCPKRIALATLRHLYLFDLVRVCLLPLVAPDIRRAAEEALLSRVPHLPVGEKMTLARRGPARVASAIVAEGHAQAMKLALENPYLTESQILKVLAKNGVAERVVVAIATHPKWSCLYNVRAALLRNPQAPLPLVRGFLGDLALRDLTDIAWLRDLSAETQKLIAEELERRVAKDHAEADTASGEE
jgi:hypothetical protein